MPLLIFIYSMIGLLICKDEPIWQEVSVESLILRRPLRPMGLLYDFKLGGKKIVITEQPLKRIDFWQKISWYIMRTMRFICNYVKRLLVNCDGWCCMRNTPRNDQGSTNGWHCKWEHDKDPLTDEAGTSSEFFDIICVAWLNQNGIFFRRFSEPWYSTVQLDGRCRKQSTPRTRMQRWMTQQTKHTKDQGAEMDDPANGAHQGSTTGLCSFQWVSKTVY